jgi:putative chitinase
MTQKYEVLVGALNLRDKPGGAVLTRLSRPTQLEELDPPVVDESKVRWLHVKVLPSGAMSGYVCEQYVGRVDATGPQGPQAGGTLQVTEAQLRMLTPTAKPWILTALTTSFAQVTSPYGILANPRRLCHFLAQAAHESAGFRTLEEYGGETYWKRYEGRADLGNSQPGDGIRYHGRGIFQLTGRANYRQMGSKISLALEDDPHLAADGDVSLRTACEYWQSRKLQLFADSNDIDEVTRRINGGKLGLAERKAFFRRAWSIWGDPNQPSGV